MDLKTIQNVSGKAMTGNVGGKNVVLEHGATYSFDTVCHLIEFLVQNPDVGPSKEITNETIELINRAAAQEGCAERIGGSGVGSATEGAGSSSVSPEGDSPDQQGAPTIEPGSVIDAQFGAYGEP